MRAVEANVSIFLPNLLNNQDMYESCMNVHQDGVPYTGQLYGNKIMLGDSNEYAILVSDVDLSLEDAKVFFNEIMEYHHEKDNLPENEIVLRDEEVKSKWLNGNFNWWCLGAGTLDDAEYRNDELNV